LPIDATTSISAWARAAKGESLRIYINTAQNVDRLAADARKAGIALDGEPPRHTVGQPRVRSDRAERLQTDDRV
jgi:hypothetical protein